MGDRPFYAQQETTGKTISFRSQPSRAAAQLESEVEQLARVSVAKPSVPVTITKEHINSVARAMGAGMTAFADGDLLLGALAARGESGRR